MSGKKSQKPKKKAAAKTNNGAALGFETTLWKAADKLRNRGDYFRTERCPDVVVTPGNFAIGELVRAKLRVIVKRVLRKHGYPPDKQEEATQIVLKQAELLSAGRAEVQ